MEIKLNREYPHLMFKKNWEISQTGWFLLGRITGFIQACSEVPIAPDLHSQLLSVSLKKGAQSTTAIEGNTLSDEEINKIEAGEKLPLSKQYQEIEVLNILDAMNMLLKEVAAEYLTKPITAELIKNFNYMVGKGLGEHFDAFPGKIRADDRIVAKYRCPDYRDIPILLENLCEWIKKEFKYTTGKQPLYDAIIQAIVTHIYIEWIHPFGDGNGRTGRLLEFYILLRAGMPDIGSHILSNHYNNTRSEYYRQIESAHNTKDLSNFIIYALQGLHDGLEEILDKIQKAQFKTAWESYIYKTISKYKIKRQDISDRRKTLISSMEINKFYNVFELVTLNGIIGRLYANISTRTFLRDLEYLEKECNLIKKVGNQYTTNSDLLLLSVPARLKKNNI